MKDLTYFLLGMVFNYWKEALAVVILGIILYQIVTGVCDGESNLN